MRNSLAVLLIASTPGAAWGASPTPVPLPPTIPAPRDTPYPGLIALSVDPFVCRSTRWCIVMPEVASASRAYRSGASAMEISRRRHRREAGLCCAI
jgi:hypothetical protein